MKDFLGFENARNKRNAGMYERLLKQALHNLRNFRSDLPYTSTVSVLIGHHITFELDGDLGTENEIPSADCLMFDHELMGAVFGDEAVEIMVMLASVPCDERDAMLGRYLDRLKDGKYPVRIEEGSNA